MNNLEQKRILNSLRFQIKMAILALTDPQRSEAEYRVSPVHLSPQLQRQRRALSDINLRSQEQESQLSGICAASSQSWGELPLTVTSYSSHSRTGQRLWRSLPCCEAQISQSPWRKETSISFPQHLLRQQDFASCKLARPCATDMKWT